MDNDDDDTSVLVSMTDEMRVNGGTDKKGRGSLGLSVDLYTHAEREALEEAPFNGA